MAFCVAALAWGLMSWVSRPVPIDQKEVLVPRSTRFDGNPAVSSTCDTALPGSWVTNLPVCDDGRLVSTDENGMGARACWEVPGATTDVATDVLTFYRDAGGFDLAFDGYLDLFGQVWGCVVTVEEGWSELVIVDGRRSGGEPWDEQPQRSCSVVVARLGEAEVRDIT